MVDTVQFVREAGSESFEGHVLLEGCDEFEAGSVDWKF
jgi:hypothetical protein